MSSWVSKLVTATFISALALIGSAKAADVGFLYKYCKQVKKKKQKITKSFIGYVIISSLISLMAFLSTIFYLDDNNVFDCFINYNEIFANLMFFMSYCIIIVVSTFENYCYQP